MDFKSEPAPAGHRDAMGEYIPAPGGKPLTGLSAATPGPADYSLPDMNTHKQAAPAYLLVGRPAERSAPAVAANAASYNIRQTSSNDHSLPVTLKPRLSAPDYRCSPGPVHRVTVGDVASRPARTTFKTAPAAGVTVGLPSPLDRGIVSAPAPVYNPVTVHLPSASAYSLAARLPIEDRTAGPGPGVSDLRAPPAGPHHSFPGRPRPVPPPTRSFPGPGAHDPVPVTAACHAPIIGQLLHPRGPSPTPPPNTYNIPAGKSRESQMTFRPFESEIPQQESAGPNAYSPEKPARRRAPAYSLAGPPESSQSAKTAVGPASYKLTRETKQRPAYSFGLKPAHAASSTPGPNAYEPHEPPGTRRGFPLIGRGPSEVPATTPAPNAYSPRPVLRRAPRFPLGLRHLDTSGRQQQLVPSPAAYSPASCRCGSQKPGASLKGRASRYVYSGLDRNKPLGTMSEPAQRTRPVIY